MRSYVIDLQVQTTGVARSVDKFLNHVLIIFSVEFYSVCYLLAKIADEKLNLELIAKLAVEKQDFGVSILKYLNLYLCFLIYLLATLLHKHSHIHTYTLTHTHTRTQTNTCTHIHIHTHTHTQTHTHIHQHIHIHIHKAIQTCNIYMKSTQGDLHIKPQMSNYRYLWYRIIDRVSIPFLTALLRNVVFVARLFVRAFVLPDTAKRLTNKWLEQEATICRQAIRPCVRPS